MQLLPHANTVLRPNANHAVAVAAAAFLFCCAILDFLFFCVTAAVADGTWQRTVAQEAQKTTVAAWLNMVVIWKQPGHFTSCADMCVCVCVCV
jgi:hypothetical protein